MVFRCFASKGQGQKRNEPFTAQGAVEGHTETDGVWEVRERCRKLLLLLLGGNADNSYNMKKLFVDLGHSVKYPGAIGIKSEVQWNRAIWLHLRDLLDKKMYEIVLVPDKFWNDYSSNRNLINRISFINKRAKPTDMLLSIHGNAATNPKARGVTTCYMGGSESGRKEAAELSEVYAEKTGVPIWNGGAFDDRNGRFGRIGMVRDTTPFALLIEAGFVTNKEDMGVDSITAARAITKYFNEFSF